MVIELINTGTELLLGRVLNTHQQWLCRQLADRGYTVHRQVAVADTAADIESALRDALSRADWILLTGGLGPTSDDLTRERVARLLGRALHEDAGTLERVRGFYAQRKRALPEGVEVQALVPDGARILANAHGTAPGLLLRLQPNPFRADSQGAWVAMLPGPPRELRPMFAEQLLPILETEAPPMVASVCCTLRTTGLGESQIEERLGPWLPSLVLRGLEVGYCARPGEVDIRFLARGPNAAALVEAACGSARDTVGDLIYGSGDEGLETVVVKGLIERGRTLAVAESCTGGLLGSRITDVPGSSRVFVGGWIAYSNAAKESELGVAHEILEQHGAVSEPVVRAMAEGARRQSGAHYALAVTGIAGPDGGTPAKPVGTVFIALATPEKTRVVNPRNAWDRLTFKQVTTQQALDLLRRDLVGGD